MTLQQEAYARIDHMSEDGIRFFLNMMDSLQNMSNRDFMMNVQYDPGEYVEDRIKSPDLQSEMDTEEMEKSRNILLLSDIVKHQSEEDEDFVSEKVIDNALSIVFHLTHQPEIFKTRRNSLHLQFELQGKSYMEIEVFEDRVTCMVVPQRNYDEAVFPEIPNNDVVMRLNEIVEEFYNAE